MGSRFTLRSFLVIAGFSAVVGVSGSAANGADTIRISGSSTVFPITKAAIQGYRTTTKGKSVDFDIKETGSTQGSANSATAIFLWLTHRGRFPARSLSIVQTIASTS